MGDELTRADGALLPQLVLAYEWAPALFGSPRARSASIPSSPPTGARSPADPIAARLLKETRDAITGEQARAQAARSGS